MKKKEFKYLTEPELKAVMTECAFAIERAFDKHGINDKPLFILYVFNDPKIAQYISSANRSDAITAMRECADRLERKDELARVRFPE